MKYSKGIMWLDDTRIPFVDSDKETINFDRPRIREKKDEWIMSGGKRWDDPDVKEYNTQGRFTPNLLVCDDMLNDGSVSNSSSNERKNNITQKIYGGGKGIPPQTSKGFDDKGTNSRYYDLDKWFDKVIDEIQ
jgi:hypothetical protein